MRNDLVYSSTLQLTVECGSLYFSWVVFVGQCCMHRACHLFFHYHALASLVLAYKEAVGNLIVQCKLSIYRLLYWTLLQAD